MDSSTTAPAHTPGPWRVGEWPSDGDLVIYDAEFTPCTAGIAAIITTDPNFPANAHLLAAAPAMLAALVDIVFTLDAVLGNVHDDEMIKDAIAAVSAAIAQARGDAR